MIRIAFGFQARVGKDTAADFLVLKYGGEKFAFAAPLKEIRDFAQETVGVSAQKDRALLQFLGDWARSRDPDVFVNALARSLPRDRNVFISDVRFKSEFAFLKSEGFLLVLIKRRGAVASTSSKAECTHASEHGLHDAPWDHTIQNFGTREEFFDQLCELVTSHFPFARVVKSYCCSIRDGEGE